MLVLKLNKSFRSDKETKYFLTASYPGYQQTKSKCFVIVVHSRVHCTHDHLMTVKLRNN